MFVKYKPTLKDFTTLQLFAARQTPRFMKQANAQKWIGRLLFLLIAVIFGYKYVVFSSYFSLIVCIVALFSVAFYPKFNLWLYKMTVRSQFRRVEQKRGDGIITLTIDENELNLADTNGCYTMATSNIVGVYEVAEYFFIQMHKELFLSVPKDQVQDVNRIKVELEGYARSFNFPYIYKSDWVSDIYDPRSKF